jgi:hypothetical protein
MDPLRQILAPLTDWMPDAIRNQLSVEAWWGIFLAIGLIALLIVALVLRRMVRALFGGGKKPLSQERSLVEDMEQLPLPTRPEGPLQLFVYHVPVRLRLLIVAPTGRDTDVDATAIEKLLDRLLPGMKAILERDRPRIRVWQAQLSHQGFVHTFHRSTPVPGPEGQPSQWVLVAGRALLGRQPLLLGLGLWSQEPQTLGRINLEPHQWLDVLRLRTREK